MEYVGLIPYDPTNPARQDLMRATEDANDFILSFRQSSNCFRLTVGGTSQTSGSPSFDIAGHLFHVFAFGDRGGSVYFYIDGEAIGSADISAEVATNINSDTVLIGGQMLANAAGHRFTLLARLFVLSGTFPTADEMAAIAMQRYLDPDAESPTLAARANYATERRLDVDFVDIDQDGTTVTNNGTGGDLTIGGGLRWRECRTQAERTAITIPDENWYSFDESHEATNAAANLSCVQGSYVCEIVYKDTIVPQATNDTYFELRASGGDERLRMNQQAVGNAYNLAARSNATWYGEDVYRDGYAEYGRNGLHVSAIITDADADTRMIYINGVLVNTVAMPPDLNLSGNINIKYGEDTARDGILAIRIWNAASLPADYTDIIKRRVTNPWTVTDGFSGMTLRANWECRINASISQPAGSTLIKNQANPGTGDLTISGGGTLADSTVLAVRGL